MAQSRKNPSWYVPEDVDPLLEMLKVYDRIIQDLQALDTEMLIATGLSQEPYMQSRFYYRLKNHCRFLERIGINYERVASYD